jgi:hypothetical protein
MELSFQSPTLRAHWTNPSLGELGADELEAGKQVIEDLIAATTLEDLRFVYDLGYEAGTVTFDASERVTITCLVDDGRVSVGEDRLDLSGVTRVQLVSINKIGGAS